ncbi:MAG: hypothetical protein HY775_03550 [Acidobacteria bacterium]|nr:hypothetical protein [Acidobacteriota bacterium]
MARGVVVAAVALGVALAMASCRASVRGQVPARPAGGSRAEAKPVSRGQGHATVWITGGPGPVDLRAATVVFGLSGFASRERQGALASFEAPGPGPDPMSLNVVVFRASQGMQVRLTRDGKVSIGDVEFLWRRVSYGLNQPEDSCLLSVDRADQDKRALAGNIDCDRLTAREGGHVALRATFAVVALEGDQEG